MPIYNFVTHRREERTVSMYGANVLIFEGILSFHNKQVGGTMARLRCQVLRLKKNPYVLSDVGKFIRIFKNLPQNLFKKCQRLPTGLN